MKGEFSNSEKDAEDLELEEYLPSLPMIKVSLGLVRPYCIHRIYASMLIVSIDQVGI